MLKARNHVQSIFILLALFLGSAALTACDQEGPLEKAGETADEAVNDAKRAVKDAAD